MILQHGTIVRDRWGAAWRIIGHNPRQVTYYDEDAQTIDETNWDAMTEDFDAEGLGEIGRGAYDPRTWPTRQAGRRNVFADAETAARCTWVEIPHNVTDDVFIGWPTSVDKGDHGDAATIGHGWLQDWTAVRVGSDAEEAWEDCARALANYPILDEDTYSEHEYAAWERYWGDWARQDVAGNVAARIAGHVDDPDRADDVADAVSEWLTDHAPCFDDIAHEGMGYFHGFTGDYDDDGAIDAAERYLRDAVTTWDAAMAAMMAVGRYAAGVRMLPFGKGVIN